MAPVLILDPKRAQVEMGTVIRGGDSGADQAPTGETVGGCADGWEVRSERKSESQVPAGVWPGRLGGGAAVSSSSYFSEPYPKGCSEGP